MYCTYTLYEYISSICRFTNFTSFFFLSPFSLAQKLVEQKKKKNHTWSACFCTYIYNTRQHNAKYMDVHRQIYMCISVCDDDEGKIVQFNILLRNSRDNLAQTSETVWCQAVKMMLFIHSIPSFRLYFIFFGVWFCVVFVNVCDCAVRIPPLPPPSVLVFRQRWQRISNCMGQTANGTTKNSSTTYSLAWIETRARNREAEMRKSMHDL